VATLREVRRRKFLNQRELAERAGVSRATINAIEAGKTRPYMHTIRAIAGALGIDPVEVDWQPMADQGYDEAHQWTLARARPAR